MRSLAGRDAARRHAFGALVRESAAALRAVPAGVPALRGPSFLSPDLPRALGVPVEAMMSSPSLPLSRPLPSARRSAAWPGWPGRWRRGGAAALALAGWLLAGGVVGAQSDSMARSEPLRPSSPAAPRTTPRPTVAPAAAPSGVRLGRVQLGQVRVAPSEAGTVTVQVEGAGGADAALLVRARLTELGGRVLHTEEQPVAGAVAILALPSGLPEGGHLLEVELLRGGRAIDRAERVYSVVADVAYDVRYGFYADFGPGTGVNFEAQADQLVDAYLNAIEYYDWFPAHGDYTPDQPVYTQEPFGRTIHLNTLQSKMEAASRRGIQNIAYVAAYAAVPRVADLVPRSRMLDAGGQRLAFLDGRVATERELGGAWFHLTAIAEGTPWRAYLMNELREMLDADDTISFDGVELDTYGRHEPYFDELRRHDGTPLIDILAGLAGDVRALVRSIHPSGLTTLNNVAEAGVEGFRDKADFLFMENWASHKPRYEETLRMVFARAAASGRRVVTKCYPADMTPPHAAWPADNLRLLMGAHLAGGGSFMAAGEPRPATGEMGGLRTHYYPDHAPMPAENLAILRAYNALDAALYRRTHGPGILPRGSDLPIPGAIATFFEAEDGAQTWCFLRLEGADRWTVPTRAPRPLLDHRVTLTLVNGIVPRRVLYANPDDPAHAYPRQLPFADGAAGTITVTLPSVGTFGAIIVEPAPMQRRAYDAADRDTAGGAWPPVAARPRGVAAARGEVALRGWEVATDGAEAAAFLGDSATNGTGDANGDGDINTGGRSWGIFSGAKGSAEISRPIPALAVGESLRVHLDIGWVADKGETGFALRPDGAASDVFAFYFRGGGQNFLLRDALGERATEIPFAERGFDVELTRTGPSAWDVRVVPVGDERMVRLMSVRFDVPGAAATSATRLRVFSSAAGGDPRHATYVNRLSVYRRPVAPRG